MDLGIKESCALMMIAAFIHFIVKSVLKNKLFDQDRVTELDYSNPQSSAELSEDNKTPHSTSENEDISNETTSSEEMTDVETADKSLLDSEPHSESDLKFSKPSLTIDSSENSLKPTANNSLLGHEPHTRINRGSFETLNPTEDRMNCSEENFTTNALQTRLNPVNSAETSDDKIPNEEMFDVTAIKNCLLNHQPGLESALNVGERNLTSKLLGNNITLTLDSEARSLRSVTLNEEDSTVSEPTNIDTLISAKSSLEFKVAGTTISLEQVTSNEKDSIDLSIPTDSDTQCDMFQLSMKTYETLVQLIRIGAETVNVSRSMTQAALVVNEISEYTIESPKIVVNSTLIETFKKLVKTCAESEELVHEGLKLNLDILDSHVNLDARLTTFESLQETIRTALSICRQLTQSIGNSDDIGTVVRNVLYYLNQQILASEPTVDIKTVTTLETDSCEMEIRHMLSTSPSAPEWSNDSFQNLTETEPTVVIDNFCDYFRGLEGKFRSCLTVLEKQVCQIAKTIEETNILLFDNLLDSMDDGCKHSSDFESQSMVLQMSPQLNGISECITNEKLNDCYLKSSERLTSNLFVTKTTEEILQVNTIPINTVTNVLRDSEIKMLEEEQVNIHLKVEDTVKVESKDKSGDRSSNLETLSISHQLCPQLDETSEQILTKEELNAVFLKTSEDLTSSLFVTDTKEDIQQIDTIPAKITGEVLQIPVTKRNTDSPKTSENLTSYFIAVENSETLKVPAIPAEVTDDVSQLITDKKNSGNGLKTSEDMTSGLVAIENSEETLKVDAIPGEITDVVLRVTETKMNVNVLESSDESTSGHFAKENSEEILNAVAIPVDAIQQVVESKMLDDEQEVFDVHFQDEFSVYALDTVPMEFIYPCLPYFMS